MIQTFQVRKFEFRNTKSSFSPNKMLQFIPNDVKFNKLKEKLIFLKNVHKRILIFVVDYFQKRLLNTYFHRMI